MRNRSPIDEGQLDLFEAVLREGVSVKVDLASLEHPLFSVAKQPSKAVRTYAIGKDCEVTIIPSAAGAPTIHDKDILVYCTSQLKAAINAGLKVSPVLLIHAYDLLQTIGRHTGGRDYKRLSAALKRLRSTTIETRIRTAGVRQERGFGLIDYWELVDRPTVHSPRLKLRLSDWLYRAIVAGEILTMDEDYFRLEGLEKRLYEIVRKHLGEQTAFRISLHKLHEKSGSQAPLRRFRFELRSIVDRAEHRRVSEMEHPLNRFLLCIVDEQLVAYQNSPEGRSRRASDALKSLRSQRPGTPATATPVLPLEILS